jgi:hypothetical protein
MRDQLKRYSMKPYIYIKTIQSTIRDKEKKREGNAVLKREKRDRSKAALRDRKA